MRFRTARTLPTSRTSLDPCAPAHRWNRPPVCQRRHAAGGLRPRTWAGIRHWHRRDVGKDSRSATRLRVGAEPLLRRAAGGDGRGIKGSSAAAATGRSLARGELCAHRARASGLWPAQGRSGRRDRERPARRGARRAHGCGLRRDELATLMVGDLELAQRRVVRHKGNKERVVPVLPGAWNALWDYPAVRVEGLVDARGEASLLSPSYKETALFVWARRGGRCTTCSRRGRGRPASRRSAPTTFGGPAVRGAREPDYDGGVRPARGGLPLHQRSL